MNKTFTQFFTGTPLILIACIFIATGCHTPEDLREIGPQNEFQEYNMEPQFSDPDVHTVDNMYPTIPDNGPSLEMGRIKLKTPIIMSSEEKPICKKC